MFDWLSERIRSRVFCLQSVRTRMQMQDIDASLGSPIVPEVNCYFRCCSHGKFKKHRVSPTSNYSGHPSLEDQSAPILTRQKQADRFRVITSVWILESQIQDEWLRSAIMKRQPESMFPRVA